MIDLIMDEKEEKEMDERLRQVLSKESHHSHDPGEMDVLFAYDLKIGDTEGIKHNSQEHVLSDEGQFAVPLNLW